MPSDSNRETRMPPLRQILAVLALGASLASQTAVAAECPYPGKVVFAGLNWESGMFTTDLLRYVLEKGYGCETDALPGNTVTMENALRQNDSPGHRGASGPGVARCGARRRRRARCSPSARR